MQRRAVSLQWTGTGAAALKAKNAGNNGGSIRRRYSRQAAGPCQDTDEQDEAQRGIWIHPAGRPAQKDRITLRGDREKTAALWDRLFRDRQATQNAPLRQKTASRALSIP